MKLIGVKQCINAGMTQREISKRARVSPEQLCRYLNNQTTPTIQVLSRIAHALHMTIDELENGKRGK